MELIEKNEGSYLSAGEIPVATLYLTWSIIYFLGGISWWYILKTSKGDVFKIHYLMTALVFIKSISLTFHAINIHYIAVNGKHEAIWAILFYITYVWVSYYKCCYITYLEFWTLNTFGSHFITHRNIFIPQRLFSSAQNTLCNMNNSWTKRVG